MLSRVRLFLACLLLLAIPLQGLAAAGMLYCGGAAAHAHGHPTQAAGAEHDHRGHPHSGHDHAVAEPQQEAGPAATLPGAGHKCGACAACCHAVAIAAAFQPMAAASAPQAPVAEPVLHLYSRSAPVPDKPPRA